MLVPAACKPAAWAFVEGSVETGVCLNMELPRYHVGDDVVMEEYLGRVSRWLPAWARWRLVAAVKTCFWRSRWLEIRAFTIQHI